MSLPDAVSRQVAALLSAYAGTRIRIARSEPVAEGWSAQFDADPWPCIRRCTLDGATGAMPRSVIVKMRRPRDHWRGEPERMHNERVALDFLTAIGSTAGPRLLAADDEAGILIMEDLGAGPALDNLLVGSDPSAAERGLVAFAAALGWMHADTAGHAAEYYRVRSKLGSVDPAFDRANILGHGVERAWLQLREIVAARPYLPMPDGVDSGIDELLRILSAPGPYLAFSNGDVCPANCRTSGDGVMRFIDFEQATFHHALLDAAALRFPFPACPCWSRLPDGVSRRAEDVYRAEMARPCPEVLDEASYAQGLAAACAAWTIVRAVRLPKLENADAAHPMGFSRRGQLLDVIGTTVDCARQSRGLWSLASWLADLSAALRIRWPHVAPTQPLYPAYRLRNPS